MERDKRIQICVLIPTILNIVKASVMAIILLLAIVAVTGLGIFQFGLSDWIQDILGIDSYISGYGILTGGALSLTNMLVIVVVVIAIALLIVPLIMNIIMGVHGVQALSYYNASGLTSKCKSDLKMKLIIEFVFCVIAFLTYWDTKSVFFNFVFWVQNVSVMIAVVGLGVIREKDS